MLERPEGSYTRTEAFNFIKKLLGLKKRTLINKRFFYFFFQKEIVGNEKFYVLKESEELTKALFDEKNLMTLNEEYYKKKEEGKIAEAEKIKEKVFEVIKH